MSLLIYTRFVALFVLGLLVGSFVGDFQFVGRIWLTIAMLVALGISFVPNFVLLVRSYYDRSGTDPVDATNNA